MTFPPLVLFGELTAELLQGFLRVGLAVAAFADVAGLQLHRGPHRRQRTATRLQVHLGEQLFTSCPRLVVHLLVPTWEESANEQELNKTVTITGK